MMQATCEPSGIGSSEGGAARQAWIMLGQRGAKGQPGSPAAEATVPEISFSRRVV